MTQGLVAFTSSENKRRWEKTGISDVFLYHFLPYSFDTGSLNESEVYQLASWLASELQENCLHTNFQCWEKFCQHVLFLCRVWGIQTQVPLAFMAGILLRSHVSKVQFSLILTTFQVLKSQCD